MECDHWFVHLYDGDDEVCGRCGAYNKRKETYV
jgi:hypothetical protein